MYEKDSLLSEEELEVVTFGLAQGKIWLLCFSIVLLSVTVFQILWEGLLFAITFSIIRIYAGGYHAMTQFRCGVISCFILFGSCVFCRYMPLMITGDKIWILATVISAFFLYVLFQVPIDTVNKRLDNKEMKIYGKRARVIATAEYVLFISSCFFHFPKVFIPISASFICIFLLIAMGKRQNRRLKE